MYVCVTYLHRALIWAFWAPLMEMLSLCDLQIIDETEQMKGHEAQTGLAAPHAPPGGEVPRSLTAEKTPAGPLPRGPMLPLLSLTPWLPPLYQPCCCCRRPSS